MKTMLNKLLLLGLFIGGLTASGQEPPHIIVILADDMAFSDIGAFGGEITTDVSESHPKIVDELRTKLYTWRSYLPELTPERADPARK